MDDLRSSCLRRRMGAGALFVFVSVSMLATVVAEEKEEEAASAVDLAATDALIDDSDREHWSFQPVRRPAVPAVNNKAWPANPIDHFILAELERRGWQPAHTVAKRALLRRMFLDLIGLPPTLAEQAAFLNDDAPDAVTRQVDNLLARPEYGERWARHWLDLVRYAETNGYERDAAKPHVWRYRDYVIAALNEDKPFDRFVLEQLAGDELPDSDPQTVIATGYYRLGPWDDEPADPATDRYDQLDDMVSTTSLVFQGLTLGCARCHNHKFEPLTAHDYYRLVAVFNPLTRPQQGRTDLDRPAGSYAQRQALAKRDMDIAALNQQAQALRDKRQQEFLKSGQSKLPPEAVAAFLTEDRQRTPEQKKLTSELQQQLQAEVTDAYDDDTRQRLQDLASQIADLRAQTPDLPRGYFFEETSNQAPVSHLLVRGSVTNPGPVVQPGVPTVLAPIQPEFPESGPFSTRRRLTLARWIASADNPLTARVIVNRVWQHHLGKGIVRTPNDFGVMGDAPTHQHLLDWLADWFTHEGGWSLKRLHRLIMTSHTYQMSKTWNNEFGPRDPENRALWRAPYVRLEVEALRDSMLAAGGQLNKQMYGPSMYPHVPAGALTGHSDPTKIWQPFDERAASRRTVYAFIKRSLVVPMLEVLDLCDTTKSTPVRDVTSVAPQALTLFNGDFVKRQAAHLAQRIQTEAGEDVSNQIELAYLLTVCRPPTPAEQQALQSFFTAETTQLISDSKGQLTEPVAQRTALQQICRVILNLNEFAYPD